MHDILIHAPCGIQTQEGLLLCHNALSLSHEVPAPFRKPFITRIAIDAHEEAFAFFKGMPQEVVYDQDRLFLIDEHLGELLLTQESEAYVFEQEFKTHFLP